jgi:3-hydroxyisobutyrate dehydrogenase-like beta-hydroxyacid dehydrogenase
MNISVLGMGKMGRALAGRLAGEGHDITIWNRSAGRGPELVAQGAREAGDIAHAVRGAEVVVTSLSNDDAVRSVALGDGGIRSAIFEDALYVDASTVAPALTEELGKAFQRYLAMPILGAPVAVSSGEAVYLIGGSEEAASVIQGWFPGLSEKHFRYTEPTKAAAAKLAINTLLLDGLVALCEAVAVGRAGGLSDVQLRELLDSSPMVAPGWKNRLEGVLSGHQEPWWSAVLGAKDARLAMDLASAAGIELPETGAALRQYERLGESAEGVDIAGVAHLYQR